MADEKTDPSSDGNEDEEALRKQLEVLQKKQDLVTGKGARAEIRYKIAQIQWQLGLITDDEFREVEEFYESFTYEWS